jgi:hypothetical protein
MNKLTVIGFLATAVAVAAQTQPLPSASVAYYVEPSAVIAFPGHFDNAVGGALALGATINNVHSIEADVISFKTKADGEDFTFTPVLATYKYRFPLNGELSLMAGASVGATFEKNDYLYSGMFMGGGSFYIHDRQTAFTSGLVGGISYVFSDHVSLDANAHLLRLEKTGFTTGGNMLLITVGLKFRF